MMNFYDETQKVWCGERQPSVLNPEANLGQVILNLLERDPDQIAQISVDSGAELTRNEIRLRAIRVAQHLTELGYKKGDMVTIAAGNSDNLAAVVYGCFLIGAPMNPLAPIFKKEDLAHMMSLTKPVLLFCDENNLNAVTAASQMADVDPKIFVFGKNVDELIQSTGTEHLFYPNYLGDSKSLLAVILCSSGTTGLAKGVCLSHAHLIATNNNLINLNLGLSFNFSAMFWYTGFASILQMAFHANTRLITSQVFDENLTFDLIEKYKINFLFTPPSYAALLLKNPRIKSADLSSLEHWKLGGGVVPESLKQNINRILENRKSVVGYGMSELGYIAVDEAGQRPNSVGILCPNMQGKIVNEDGVSLNNGEDGELCIKFIYTFLGYIKNEEAFRDILDDEGWVHTGDIGHFDEEGYLYIVDRKKDIMKYRNYQISPSDVETLLQQIEGVAQSCVLGIPDEDQTSDLVTAVVIKAEGADIDEEKIISYVDRNASDHKKLRGGVYFMDAFPMTPSGKIQKNKIKATILEIRKNNLK